MGRSYVPGHIHHTNLTKLAGGETSRPALRSFISLHEEISKLTFSIKYSTETEEKVDGNVHMIKTSMQPIQYISNKRQKKITQITAGHLASQCAHN